MVPIRICSKMLQIQNIGTDPDPCQNVTNPQNWFEL
jgi:hypothetical protein